MYIVDVSGNGARLIFASHVGHGVNSDDGGNSVVLEMYLNQKSHQLGFLKVAETYQGKYGYSIQLMALSGDEPSNARGRAIVFHTSHYSTIKVIQSYRRMGNSWGLFYCSPFLRTDIFDTINGGTLLYAFHDSSPSSGKW